MEQDHWNDRLAVTEVIGRYGISLDDRDWERLSTCFIPEAVGLLGSPTRLEGYEAIESAIRAALELYDATQHHIAVPEVEITGDEASLRANLIATHVGGGGILTVGGVYRDRLVRTSEGWRISYHELQVVWTS